jgi:hypothetical protein
VPIDQPLIVSPSLLDFGQVEVGRKSVLSVIIKKSNGSHLNWQIDPANAQWLQIALKPHATTSNNPGEDIYDVTATTSKLHVGKYSAVLQVNSESGSTTRVPVKMQVIPNTTPPPAKLTVNPLLLDFGSQNVGIQKTQLLTVSNTGGQELRWSVNKGNAPWLTLDQSSGKIASGAIPQSVNVKVDTTALIADHYSTTINFSSNGGNAPVVVQLIVIPPRTGITATPSPTPTPTPSSIQRQISSTQTQSRTVKATGTGQVPATHATGTLTFYNLRADYSFKVPAGQTWTGTDGIQVVNDAPVCLDAVSDGDIIVGHPVPAHTLQTGTAANIAVGDVNMIWGVSPFYSTSSCSSASTAHSSAIYALTVPLNGTQEVRNDTAFTGGQDVQIFTFVQQSDIDGSATSLKNSTQQSAINDIQQQLQPNEHLVGDPRCTSDIASDHNAGDKVNQVTVTVTTTCKETAST